MCNTSKAKGLGFWFHTRTLAPLERAGMAAANIMTVEKRPWHVEAAIGSRKS